MTCNECQRSLLQMLDPSTPPVDGAEHLAQCTVCQQYQRRLLRIETNVLRLPVPPSNALDAVKRALLEVDPARPAQTIPSDAAAGPGASPLVVPGPAPLGPRRSFSRSRLLFIGSSMAAAILLAVVGLWHLFQGSSHDHQPIANAEGLTKDLGRAAGPEAKMEQNEEKPPLGKLLQIDVGLSVAVDGLRQTEAMRDLAGLLQDGMESRPDAATTQTLASLYQVALVGDPPARRGGLVVCADRLAKEDPDMVPAVLVPLVQDLMHFQKRSASLLPVDMGKKVSAAIGETRERLVALLPAGTKIDAGQTSRNIRPAPIDWKRDLPLIEAMVATAGRLVLVDEKDPLSRARIAHELGGVLAREIKNAAAQRNKQRGGDMAKYLGNLLTEAIARNVGQARLDKTSSKEAIDAFVQEVSHSTRAVEIELRQAGMLAALQAVQTGRSDIEQGPGSYRNQ